MNNPYPETINEVPSVIHEIWNEGYKANREAFTEMYEAGVRLLEWYDAEGKTKRGTATKACEGIRQALLKAKVRCPDCGVDLKTWQVAFQNDLDKGKHVCPGKEKK